MPEKATPVPITTKAINDRMRRKRKQAPNAIRWLWPSEVGRDLEAAVDGIPDQQNQGEHEPNDHETRIGGVSKCLQVGNGGLSGPGR